MKTVLIAVAAVLSISSAFALEPTARKLQYVYATGWVADGAWLVPMTEQAADAISGMDAAKTRKATCQAKGVFHTTSVDRNVEEFLAYEIKDCK